MYQLQPNHFNKAFLHGLGVSTHTSRQEASKAHSSDRRLSQGPLPAFPRTSTMTGAITNPEVVINIAHEHSFIILRPLQVGRSLLRIGSILPPKPLLIAYNDFLLAVPLKEADEELDHPKGSFPERHHYKYLWEAMAGQS